MGMGGHMGTNTDLAQLTLAQWFSPGFPVGGFHFSHGLEWDIETGKVATSDALMKWIETALLYGSGHNDAVLLAAAFRAEDGERLGLIDATARALAPSRERLLETTEMGAAFARATSLLLSQDIPALTYPVAVGLSAARAKLPLLMTLQFYLQAFAANLVSVGMRLIPVGQSDGQKVIAALAPTCLDLAKASQSGDLELLGGSAFCADIASMQHETQYSRIFRT